MCWDNIFHFADSMAAAGGVFYAKKKLRNENFCILM